MQPENIDLGVLVEEFGHNFFGLPDLYTTDAENSVGFWTIMGAGSYGGVLPGSAPVGIPLWFKMNAWCDVGWCNWQEPMTTLPYNGPATETVIGQLEDTPAGLSKGVRVNLPPIVVDIPNRAGTGKGAYTGTGLDNIDITLDRELAVPADAAGVLSFDAYWDIEVDWDYGYVEVKDGDTWAMLKDMDGVFVNTNPNGTNMGWGLTAKSAAAKALRFDLAAYKGKTVTVRLRYVTDTGTTLPGWWVDNLKLDGKVVDDFEKFPEGWVNSAPLGWQVSPSTRTFANYYLVEYRSKTKYDSNLVAYISNSFTGSEWHIERVPYNIPGALVYYRNAKYPNSYSQRQNSRGCAELRPEE